MPCTVNKKLPKMMQKKLQEISNNFKNFSKKIPIKLYTFKDQIFKININSGNEYLKKFRSYISIEFLQDKLETLLRNDSNEIVLKQSKYWARSITWVLMGGTVFSLGWLAIAETEEIAIAQGKLEPIGGVVDVQMPIQGIAREILIKEGDFVEKDQVLIRLDTELTEAKLSFLQDNLKSNSLIAEKLSSLVKEGAVSEIQYLQQKTKVEDIKSQIKTNLVQLKYQEIKSPTDGIVFDLKPKSPGYVARTSEPVLQIVPNNNLVATVEIESRSIGFIKVGKKADISIDSFPASDFGVIEGSVKSIGSDALQPEPSIGKGYRFPTKISLDQQFLEIKSGKRLPLQAGMSLTANIKLRKTTYLNLLLSNFTEKAKSINSL